MCKQMQHVTSNNVGSLWPTMLHPFAWGFDHFSLHSKLHPIEKMQKLSYLSKDFTVGHSDGNGARNLLTLKSTFN